MDFYVKEISPLSVRSVVNKFLQFFVLIFLTFDFIRMSFISHTKYSSFQSGQIYQMFPLLLVVFISCLEKTFAFQDYKNNSFLLSSSNLTFSLSL